MVFEIHYDLNKPGQQYPPIIEEIKKSPKYQQMLKSGWLVSTNESLDQLFGRLRRQIDSTDRLFVSRVRNGEFIGYLDKPVVDWLNQNVT